MSLRATASYRRCGGQYGGRGEVRLVTLEDGPARGVRVLEFRTASGLAFEIAVDRGMDLLSLDFRGERISWSSPTGLTHPHAFDAEAEQGLGLLRGMTGLLVTSGLDHILGPERTEAGRFGYPSRSEISHPLHGRISNIPATLQGYGVRETADGPVLWATGQVRQVSLFGENLRLTRTVEVPAFGTALSLVDEVTNDGFVATPHAVLYHVNLGWPFLDEAVRFSAPLTATRWQSSSVTTEVPFAPLPPPTEGFVEQCFDVGLERGADGWSTVAARQPRTGTTVSLSWDAATLPSFIQWVNAQPGSYAMAWEPATHGVGESPRALAPDESVTYRLRIDVAADAAPGYERVGNES